MDIYCTTCGEPCDIDCLHDPEEYGVRLRGRTITDCDACEWHRRNGFPLLKRGAYGLTVIEAQEALAEIMGDDVDGIASELADLF